MAGAYAGNVKADIVLSENNVQSQYSIINDESTQGYDIICTIEWANLSDNVDANNQISANGTFGSNLGFYKIDSQEYPHDVAPPTYTINPDSFDIAYAPGVVNTPNDSDTFKFYFNLGDKVTSDA